MEQVKISILNAHVKEFETVYKKKDPNNGPKWIKVVLQVCVDNHDEANEVCKVLATHMEKPIPRFMKLTEQ